MSAPSPSTAPPAPRVLVVDDERAVCDLMVEVLSELGYDLEAAFTGEAALERVRGGSGFELVLTDLRMPGMSGLELLDAVKAIDPTLPVVLVTGYGDIQSSVEALRRGADDFLTKPLSIDDLGRVAERAIDKGKLLRENRQQRERLEKLYAVKSQFLANMSHELRTPLTTIIGMSEVLADQVLGPLTAKQLRYVGSVRDSARHLLNLINDILDFSKVEAGRMALAVGDYAPGEVMQAAAALVEGLALSRRIEIRVVAPAGNLGARGDRDRILQILVNLLSNAVKFSPEGKAVTISCRCTGGQIRFAVEDRGIGIPAESLEAVFEEFQQIHRPGAGKPAGTGLGLSLSRRLARLHGGDIQVESVFGSGSTFTLALPLVLAEAEPAELAAVS